MGETPARAEIRCAPASSGYFVLLELELPLPLGEVVAELPLDDGDVVLEGDVELELDDVSDDRGVLGEADGLGLVPAPPTRSDSVRLHASVIPPTSARAHRPDSNFFIADVPPLWGVVTTRDRGLQRACPWYDATPRRPHRAKEIAV